MVFGKVFNRDDGVSFECVYQKCESFCCKDNQIVLFTDDIELLKLEGIDPFEASSKLKLNDFLSSKKGVSMGQLEGLYLLTLKQGPDGICVFLLPDGTCRIYESRPFLCRKFPFIFAKGKMKPKEDSPCPGIGVGEKKSGEELRLYLGFDKSEKSPPFIVGDENKVKMANKIMPMVFKLLV